MYIILLWPCVSTVLLGQNHDIFHGGFGDGYGSHSFYLPSNNNIFRGGSADGYAVASFQQLNGNSIFAGGNLDGYSVAFFAQQSYNDIFTGGPADGYSEGKGFIGNPNNDCSQNHINVTNALLNNSLDDTFKALESIHSDATLNTRPGFQFRAGIAVTLQPAFTLPPGISFEIQIGPCQD